MFNGVKRLIKITLVKIRNKNVIFMKNSNISKKAVFEGQNKLGVNSWFDGYLGYGSYIGNDCIIEGKVGKYCSIGHKVAVLSGTHPTKNFVSTHPAFFSLGKQNGATYVKKQKFKEKIYTDETNRYAIEIGNDVWIGYKVTILGGVVIGDGAIIAAGAFVKDNVPPYSIVAGQPAKIIKKRFTDIQIKWLLRFKWWDKDIEWIKKNVEYFDDIESFIEHNR